MHKICLRDLAFLLAFFGIFHTVYGQTLKARLDGQTNFVPRHSSPVNQLIEVAQRFKLPMAIEWLEQSNQKQPPFLSFSSGSVLQLIDSILEQSPDHQLTVEEGIIHIFPPAAVSHPFNFLNLHIPDYQVQNGSLLEAQFILRIRIKSLLYPELYEHGWNGGYGAAPDDIFWKQNLAISGQGLTIREILNRIIIGSGNALWVVRISEDEMTGEKPKWIGVPINEYGDSPIGSRWKFIALKQ